MSPRWLTTNGAGRFISAIPTDCCWNLCTTVREFTADDKIMKHHDQPGAMVDDPAEAKKVMKFLMGTERPPGTHYPV